MTTTQQRFAALVASTVVPVIRTASTANAEKAIALLKEAGFTTFEVTLSVPNADKLIEDLSRCDGLLVGAGTVLTLEQAERSLAAGAQFIVSPITAEELPTICRDAAVPLLLSGLTPTEVQRAWMLGATAVKVFPAGSVGGPAHIKALRSVFPTVPLVPTGGVTLDNLVDYLDAGAACVGIGGNLINDTQIEQASATEWVARARAYLKFVGYQPSSAA